MQKNLQSIIKGLDFKDMIDVLKKEGVSDDQLEEIVNQEAERRCLECSGIIEDKCYGLISSSPRTIKDIIGELDTIVRKCDVLFRLKAPGYYIQEFEIGEDYRYVFEYDDAIYNGGILRVRFGIKTVEESDEGYEYNLVIVNGVEVEFEEW